MPFPIPQPSPPCSLLPHCFAVLSLQSQHVFVRLTCPGQPPPPPFLTSILSSLHLALKKNNITKFPNVYSRVRNSSSSNPVVVDVSQTWQASLYYLLSCFAVLSFSILSVLTLLPLCFLLITLYLLRFRKSVSWLKKKKNLNPFSSLFTLFV